MAESWHETNTHVYITYNYPNIKKSSVEVVLGESKNLEVSFPINKNKDLNKFYALSNKVKSHEVITEQEKVMVVLEKETPRMWNLLEQKKSEGNDLFSKKSSNVENINKIYNEVEKKVLEQDEKFFWNSIFANQTEEGRRAMQKSFQASNGRALSTDWGKEKDKQVEDYEEQLRT